MKKEYTFIPIPLQEYKKIKEKYNKEKSNYTFTPKSSNFPLKSVYKEVNKPIYVREIDWNYFDNKQK